MKPSERIQELANKFREENKRIDSWKIGIDAIVTYLDEQAELDFEDELVGFGLERGLARKFLSMQKASLRQFVAQEIEKQSIDDFKRGYEAGIEDFGTRHRPTTPEKCYCGNSVEDHEAYLSTSSCHVKPTPEKKCCCEKRNDVY